MSKHLERGAPRRSGDWRYKCGYQMKILKARSLDESTLGVRVDRGPKANFRSGQEDEEETGTRLRRGSL